MSVYRLDTLLTPGSIALVGGSPRPSSVGRALLKNIRASPFAGRLGIVNPDHAEIDGTATVKSLSELPFLPDVVVVTSPPSTIPDVLVEAGRLGVAGVAIASSGTEQPDQIAQAVDRATRNFGMRIIGPNCLGIFMPRIGLNASLGAHVPQAGNLGLISQSGGIATGIVDWAVRRNVGFSGIVSVGDELDVDVADLLDFFALDPQTKAVLMYVETIKDARKFMSAARAAARLKPVVVLKPGKWGQDRRTAATHAGVLAASDAVFGAAFRRAGMVRVFDLRELFDCAETLSRIKKRTGKRLAILTNGAGLGALAAGGLVQLGGTAAVITPDIKEKLDLILPPVWSGSNPVDVGGDADAARYTAALEILLADTACDAVLVLNVQSALSNSREIAEEVIRTVAADRDRRRTGAKPVLTVWVGADDDVSRMFAEAEIAYYSTEDDAVRGFMHLVRHGEAVELLTAVPPSLSEEFTPDVAAARQVIEIALSEGRAWLDPIEVKKVLDAYQIAMVETLVATDAEAAAVQATSLIDLGSTVVLKLLSRDIPNKSDVGGVVLNLTSADAVRSAARRILENAKAKQPDAKLDGFVVQPMILKRKARELLVGLANDPTFGMVVVFGHGGTAAEEIDDKALALPPLDIELAGDLIRQTRVARLLRAYRDVPAVKPDAVELTLVKLAQLAADFPQVMELEINPLLADESGVMAVDASIGIGRAGRKFAGSGNANFAVRPYPSQWIRHLVLNDDGRVMVRPIRPDDELLMHEFGRHLTKEDLRLRFFATMKEFKHEFIARLTQLDYSRAMAFVALDEANGELLGVVRIHSDLIYESGEYSILLRSDMKGRGLGGVLMQLLIEYARSEGLKHVHGNVLRENAVMLTMCRNLGFKVEVDPDEQDICCVRLSLDAAGEGVAGGASDA